MDVDLPHDYAISQKRSADGNGTQNNGFYPDQDGRYVKYMTFEEGKHYVLDIDGAYMRTLVYLNENYLANHPYGYTPFLVDLTPYIFTDCTNKLMISTSPLADSTRWYSGNGLYRDVFLWEGGNVRIEPWDMFVSTASVDEDGAQLRVRFAVSADKDAAIQVRFTVISGDGRCVKAQEHQMQVLAQEKMAEELLLKIENPLLWDLDTPHLYTLKTEIWEGEQLLDITVTEFGIRTISADVENGLLLNGKEIKLRGGCIHHDHGVLGAAAFPAAEERKIRLLKEAGFNALRTAHNPPSLAFLECCDRMGMIVMDEAFDAWNKGKRPNDYHWFFEDWCLRDISYMVLRERNHPCVFSYSTGNEIHEIDGTSNMGKWSRILADEIRKYDDTRFVTSGVQRVFATRDRTEECDPVEYRKRVQKMDYSFAQVNELTAAYDEPLDIIGRNYYYSSYLEEHECYPEHILWGSETQTIHFYESWQLTKELPYVLGDFTWTAYDNMGEVGTGRGVWARDGVIGTQAQPFRTGYPWRNCYQGDLDLCGYRRPQSYFRETVWLGNTEPRIFVTHPEHFGEGYSGTHWHWNDVNETWTFEDRYVGRPVKAETYTDAEKILWYVNDVPVGESVPEKGIASIETIYIKGKITAAAYKDGKEYARCSLQTTGKACAINVEAEKQEFAADRRDLCYFDISIVDQEGRLVVDGESEITCTVMGGELLGIYSGNPCNEDQYTSNTCHTFKGRALAIVRTKDPGTVGIKVYGKELAAGYAQATAI